MLPADFLKAVDFYELDETEKTKHLAFLHHKVHGIKQFGALELSEWFDAVGLSPNTSRLLKAVKSQPWSRTKGDKVELHGKHLLALEQAFPALGTKTEAVACIGEVLPHELYAGVTRNFIKRIADQVNSSYETNAYDACAVMMRRLLEILLIHTFRAKKIEALIKRPDGHYQDLDTIIGIAVNEKQLGLTQGTVKELKRCKDVGNYGAHDIIYTCKKSDIEPIILEYRKVIAHLIEYAGFGS